MWNCDLQRPGWIWHFADICLIYLRWIITTGKRNSIIAFCYTTYFLDAVNTSCMCNSISVASLYFLIRYFVSYNLATLVLFFHLIQSILVSSIDCVETKSMSLNPFSGDNYCRGAECFNYLTITTHFTVTIFSDSSDNLSVSRFGNTMNQTTL